MILEILIYSGVRNPFFEMTLEEKTELRRLLSLCTESTTEKPHGRLGYSGFLLVDGGEHCSWVTQVGDGVIVTDTTSEEGDQTTSLKDTAGVETYLLQVIRRHPEVAGHPWVPLVAGGKLPKPVLISKLRTVFSTYEGLGVRVGRVWLNADQVAELKTDSLFDRETIPTLLNAFPGLVGYLWGAQVYQSDLVPANHAAFVQDDMDATLLGSAACMPL